MKITKESKTSKLTTIKAVVALLVLATATVYTFVNLAQDNKTIMTAAGIVLTVFCVSAVIDRMN